MWSDPYAVLNIPRGSSDAAVKQAYRRALLENHPDKAEGGRFSIDDVNAAYRSIKAAPADAADVAGSADATILFSETLDLSDFQEEELGDGSFVWSRDCRCGARGYVIREQDLELNGEADEIAVQCSGCSLWINVQYAAE